MGQIWKIQKNFSSSCCEKSFLIRLRIDRIFFIWSLEKTDATTAASLSKIFGYLRFPKLDVDHGWASVYQWTSINQSANLSSVGYRLPLIYFPNDIRHQLSFLINALIIFYIFFSIFENSKIIGSIFLWSEPGFGLYGLFWYRKVALVFCHYQGRICHLRLQCGTHAHTSTVVHELKSSFFMYTLLDRLI